MAIEVFAPTEVPHQTTHRGRLWLRGPDILGLGGMALWGAGLTTINIDRMGDTGLISVIPAPCLIGLTLVLIGFVAQLTIDAGDRVRPALYVTGLVVMLDGLPCFVEQAAGVPTGYIHAGFADYILRHGAVLPNYDARFSWPGMFAWSALLTVAGGRAQALVFMRWTPLVLDLLYLLPLRLILRNLCPNPKVAWTAAAVFVLGNWVEQDYFSPQGLAFLGFLSVVAVVLATGPAGRRAPGSRPTDDVTGSRRRLTDRLSGRGAVLNLPAGRTRAGVTVCLALVVAGIVVSHQLTPYILLLDLVVLAAAGQLGVPALVPVLAVLAVGYLSIGGENYWVSHLSAVFGGVGQVGGSVHEGLVARTQVSAGHQLVVGARLVYTVALLGAGAIGLLIRRRRGDRWVNVATLAAAPWILVAFQSYGGEVFLRSLLMSLPFLAIGVAELLVWMAGQWRGVGVAASTVGLLGAAGALLLTRYGNEPFYLVTPAEIAAVQAVDRVAPSGSIIAVLDQDLPWRFEDIERYQFISFEAACAWTDPNGGATSAAATCLQKIKPDYIILTAGEVHYAELEGAETAAALDRIEYVDLPEAGYRLTYKTRDAQVFTRVGVAAATSTEPAP